MSADSLRGAVIGSDQVLSVGLAVLLGLGIAVDDDYDTTTTEGR